MASQSKRTYAQRAESHANPLVRQLFNIAETKKTNIVVSADLTTTEELLSIADRLGPHIAVLKTHTDILTDLTTTTTSRLASLAQKHNFLLFEDRKFIDIGTVVQKQYRGGSTRIADWAHLVTVSILAGQGIVDALAQSAAENEVKAMGNRGCLILAEMTTKGSLAVGEYTARSVEYARAHPEFVAGFVALSALTERSEATHVQADEDEDFVVFTTGVNMADKGDALGQQYNTPARAVAGGADFIISGRGIYSAADPEDAVQRYKKEGWEAYLQRTGQRS